MVIDERLGLSLQPDDIGEVPEGMKHYAHPLGSFEFDKIGTYCVNAAKEAGKWVPIPLTTEPGLGAQHYDIMVDSGHLIEMDGGYVLSPQAIEQIYARYPAKK